MALQYSGTLVVCVLVIVCLLIGSIFVYVFLCAGRQRRVESEPPVLRDHPEPQLSSQSRPHPTAVDLEAGEKRFVHTKVGGLPTSSAARPPVATVDLQRLPSFIVSKLHPPSRSIPQLMVPDGSKRKHIASTRPPLTRPQLRVVNDVESSPINISGKKGKMGVQRHSTMFAPKKARARPAKGQPRLRSSSFHVDDASVIDLDDVMSSQTMSTLPPSYRSRRPTISPSFNLRYLLSTSRQSRRTPLGTVTPDNPAVVVNTVGSTEPSMQYNVGSTSTRTGRARADGMRRSFDGGVRLDGVPSNTTVAHIVRAHENSAVLDPLPPYTQNTTQV